MKVLKHLHSTDLNSYLPRNSGTAKRRLWCPLGDEAVISVALGNLLAHRCILLAMLCHARGAVFFLEQPISSAMCILPRWYDLRNFCKVFAKNSVLCVYAWPYSCVVPSARFGRAVSGWGPLGQSPEKEQGAGAINMSSFATWVHNSVLILSVSAIDLRDRAENGDKTQVLSTCTAGRIGAYLPKSWRSSGPRPARLPENKAKQGV